MEDIQENMNMSLESAYHTQNGGLNENEMNSSKHSNMRASSMNPHDKKLADAKKARLQMEKDAKLLANRILLLQQEESKTWKKIEETKKRAKDVLTLKQKNEERITRQIETMKYNQEKLRQNQEKVYQLRKEREQEKKKIHESILLSKRDEALQTKMIRAENNTKKKENMAHSHLENSMRNQIIREQKAFGANRISNHHKTRLDNFKKHYSMRVEDEEKIISDKGQEISQMELIEMELIKKLKNTQAIQKNAYSELEQALSQPTYYFGAIAKKNIMNGGKQSSMSTQQQPPDSPIKLGTSLGSSK